ncbi:MAG: hypothetical protein U0457_16420 [Candidatus Sericytochromatia bacterium]
MKISLVAPDFSLKTFKRTKFLYDLLKDDFELEVLVLHTNKVKKTIFDDNFDNLKKIRFDLGTVLKDFNNSIKGDLVYAIRSKPTSFGISMNIKHFKKIPIILDIIDIEKNLCFPYSNNTIQNFLLSFFAIKDPNSYIFTFLGEKRIKLADNITVASKKLQKIYGGTYIPSIANNEIFDSEKYKIPEIREFMKWDKKVILYFGNLEYDTDFDNLCDVLKDFSDKIQLIVLNNTEEYKKIEKKYDFISFLGYQPELNQAKIISSADYTILPIKNINYSENYLPDEIYNYIACNKKIISSKNFEELSCLKDKLLIYNNKEELKNILNKIANEEIIKEKYEISPSYQEVKDKMKKFFLEIMSKNQISE